MADRRIRPRSQQSLDWYDRATVWLWLVVSVVFLVVLTLQLVGPVAWQATLFWLDWAISLSFLADYLLRLYMAPAKWRFVGDVWNLLDLFVVATPFVALVVGWMGLGYFRAFRVIRLVRIVRAPIMLAHVTGRSRHVLHRGQARLVLFAAMASVLVAATVVWKTESISPDARIHSFMDALWWAVVTMFTVGYGDLYPVTVEGRISALVLMLAGIALFGWLTASLASLFVECDGDRDEDDTCQRLAAMDARLERIEQLLAGREVDQVAAVAGVDDEHVVG